MIALLAIVTSIGTPAAPGAGAVIFFHHPLRRWLRKRDGPVILTVNRPIEMLVALPSTWPATQVVAKSENALDEARYEV